MSQFPRENATRTRRCLVGAKSSARCAKWRRPLADSRIIAFEIVASVLRRTVDRDTQVRRHTFDERSQLRHFISQALLFRP